MRRWAFDALRSCVVFDIRQMTDGNPKPLLEPSLERTVHGGEPVRQVLETKAVRLELRALSLAVVVMALLSAAIAP